MLAKISLSNSFHFKQSRNSWRRDVWTSSSSSSSCRGAIKSPPHVLFMTFWTSLTLYRWLASKQVGKQRHINSSSLLNSFFYRCTAALFTLSISVLSSGRSRSKFWCLILANRWADGSEQAKEIYLSLQTICEEQRCPQPGIQCSLAQDSFSLWVHSL